MIFVEKKSVFIRSDFSIRNQLFEPFNLIEFALLYALVVYFFFINPCRIHHSTVTNVIMENVFGLNVLQIQ